MTAHSIRGKGVLIAGGAKNLRGLIALDLAAQGAKAITVHSNTSATTLATEETAAAIRAAGADAFAVQAALITEGRRDAVRRSQGGDIAISTIGKPRKKPMVEVSEDEYDEMTAVNARSAFSFIKDAGKNLGDNGKICTPVTSLLGTFTPFSAA